MRLKLVDNLMMFSCMTAGSNNLKTEKDGEGGAQLNASHTN